MPGIRPLLRTSLLLAALWVAPSTAQPSSDPDVFLVGHSLVNTNMPHLLKKIVASAGDTGLVDVQVMNGASILANWQHPSNAQGTPYTTALPTGRYEALVLTEALPLLNHTTWSNTYQAASDFLAYARGFRPDIRLYIYETWHCINTGRTDTIIPEIAPRRCWYDNDDGLLWQPRLVADHPKWVKIVDSVKTLQSYPSVHLVPAGTAFSHLALEIQAGRVPGIRSFREFFEDDIHLNRLGNWFVANVMFATFRGRSPEGLARVIDDGWGNPHLDVPPELAATLQRIAWQTVCDVPLSGVTCATTRVERAAPAPRRQSERLFDTRGRLLRNPTPLSGVPHPAR